MWRLIFPLAPFRPRAHIRTMPEKHPKRPRDLNQWDVENFLKSKRERRVDVALVRHKFVDTGLVHAKNECENPLRPSSLSEQRSDQLPRRLMFHVQPQRFATICEPAHNRKLS